MPKTAKTDHPELLDPDDINGRLYKQLDILLDQLEEATTLPIRDRIAALVAIGRIQTIFMTLRKETRDDGPTAGSAVRKYATAFTASHAAGGRAKNRRSAPVTEPDWEDDTDAELQ